MIVILLFLLLSSVTLAMTATKVIVHSKYLHRLGAENGIVTFSSPVHSDKNSARLLSHSSVQKKKTRSRKLLSMIKTKKNSKGFVFKSKKKEQKAPGDPADLSSDAGKKFNQKEIEALTKQVHDSRVKTGAQVAAHTQLEEKLNAAMLAGGKLTPVQSHHWHGEVHTYTPKHNKWLTLPAWNGKACAIGVVTGPGGHCHRDLGSTIGTCSAKPDLKILAAIGLYSSKSCECSMCSGFAGDVFAAPYCHTRGINTCHCMLVDNAIENEFDCLDMQ